MYAKEQSDSEAETLVFRFDWHGKARRFLFVLYGFLATIIFLIFMARIGRPPESILLIHLVLLALLFGVLGEIFLFRFRRRKPFLAVCESGMAIPIANIGFICWVDVHMVEVIQRNIRGAALIFLRFHFRSGTLKRRQFGSLRKDRFDVMIETKNLFGRQSLVVGGTGNLIQSIGRFCEVKGQW